MPRNITMYVTSNYLILGVMIKNFVDMKVLGRWKSLSKCDISNTRLCKPRTVDHSEMPSIILRRTGPWDRHCYHKLEKNHKFMFFT